MADSLNTQNESLLEKALDAILKPFSDLIDKFFSIEFFAEKRDAVLDKLQELADGINLFSFFNEAKQDSIADEIISLGNSIVTDTNLEDVQKAVSAVKWDDIKWD